MKLTFCAHNDGSGGNLGKTACSERAQSVGSTIDVVCRAAIVIG